MQEHIVPDKVTVTYGPVERTELGDCGVDSGELIIIDPCYVDGPIELSGLDGLSGVSRKSPLGVTFRPGLGDGVYRVIGYDREVFIDGRSWGKRTVKVEVICIEGALEP